MPPLDVLISITSVPHMSLDYLAGLGKEEVYSTRNLTFEQKEFVSTVFAEFSRVAETGQPLSSTEFLLVQRIIQFFFQQ